MTSKFRILSFNLAFVFSAFFLLSGAPAQAKLLTPLAGEILKSPADSREYRAIQLDNGLKVMLISDATADRAAAALDVHVAVAMIRKTGRGWRTILSICCSWGPKNIRNPVNISNIFLSMVAPIMPTRF